MKLLLLGVAALALAGCEEAGGYSSPVTAGSGGSGSYGPDKSIDRGINAHHLSTLKAGVWVDPDGCDHWIIDDGVEGYMSERVDDYGKPICSGAAPPNTVVGPFKEGSPVPDFL